EQIDSLEAIHVDPLGVPDEASSTHAPKIARPATSIHDSILVSGSGSSVLDEVGTTSQVNLPRAAYTQLLVGESSAEETENPQVSTLASEVAPQDASNEFNVGESNT